MKFLNRISVLVTFVTIILISPAVISVQQAAISIRDPNLVKQEIVTEMLEWIRDNSDYAITDEKPDIRFANETHMINEWIDSGGDKDTKLSALTIVLVPGRHIITYMPIDFDWDNPQHLTFLLHELVHFQQYVYFMDIDPKCEDFMEFEAYTMALTWYMEQGYYDQYFVDGRLIQIDSVATCS